MDTRSQHLLFDAVCEHDLTNTDIDHIKSIIEKNLTVVNKIEHKFTPQGETIVFILAESHFTLHTYPENKFITMDIYVCNLEVDLQKIVDEISSKVIFEKFEQRIIPRGKIGSKTNSHDLKIIYSMTTLVACCSMLYELLLAQSLSTTMGNTALRYNTTIGLYIAAMGFGALFYKKIIKKNIFEEFVKIELILSIIGGFAPIAVLFNDTFFNGVAHSTGLSFFSNLVQVPLFVMNHSLIVVIGFLSGLELPLLIDMGKFFDKKRGNYVLAYDYLGTLLGAILFPIILLPKLHIFTMGYVVSLINILVALFVMVKIKISSKVFSSIIVLMLVVWLYFLFNANSLNELIIQKLYFGGQ